MALLRGILQDGILIGGVHVINFTGGGATITSRMDGGVNIEMIEVGLDANVLTATAGDGLSDSGTATDPILDVNVGNGVKIVSDQVEPDYGTATNKVCEGDDSRLPTQGENDALVGTDGTPSSANKFVTDSDSRLTDSRSPEGAAGGDLSPTTPADNYPDPKVVKLQGRDVAITAPTAEQCYKWVAGTSKWTPGALGASAGVDSVVAGVGLDDLGTAADPIIDVNVNNGVKIVFDNLKPDYGTAANKVCQGNDSRLSDVRIPTAHATTHEVSGSDELTGNVDANARVAVSIGSTTTGVRREVNFKAGSGVSILEQDDASGEKVDVTINSTISITQASESRVGYLQDSYDVFALHANSPIKTTVVAPSILSGSLMYVRPVRFEADMVLGSVYIVLKDGTDLKFVCDIGLYDSNGTPVVTLVKRILSTAVGSAFKIKRIGNPATINSGLYYLGFTNRNGASTDVILPIFYWDDSGSPDLIPSFGTVPTSGGNLPSSFNPATDITDRNGSTYPFAIPLFFHYT